MNLRNLNDIILHQNESNVVVGARNFSDDVYQALDLHNVFAILDKYDSVGFDLMVARGLSFVNNRDGPRHRQC